MMIYVQGVWKLCKDTNSIKTTLQGQNRGKTPTNDKTTSLSFMIKPFKATKEKVDFFVIS